MNSTTPESGQTATRQGVDEDRGPAYDRGDAAGEGRTSITDPASSGIGHGPLYRPFDDRMLAGVASGLSRFLGVDVLLVRVAIVVLCFVGGIGIPFYLASWLLIPEEGAEQSIAGEFVQGAQSRRS
jgi:phage shock protein PspC (stress-responsive transcriptional regulator)